jgi:hypothetical protein
MMNMARPGWFSERNWMIFSPPRTRVSGFFGKKRKMTKSLLFQTLKRFTNKNSITEHYSKILAVL